MFTRTLAPQSPPQSPTWSAAAFRALAHASAMGCLYPPLSDPLPAHRP
jgi:hypothetical protein